MSGAPANFIGFLGPPQ